MLLQVTETAEGLACAWEYNADLFDAETIARMAGHLQVLFAAAVADPAQPVATLPLLTEAERQLMLVDWNNTATTWDLERTFHSRFEAQATRIPDALAAVFALPGSPADTRSLTYAELDRHANQLARHLLGLGVRKGSLVGISTERSLEMVTGILGILKAGAAYLPLDPTYPAERLAFMLADSGVAALLTQSHVVERLPLAGFAAPIVRLDAEWPQIGEQPHTSPAARVTADDLAYCIYTSGSTGRPKGVLLRHRGMINLAEVHHREFDMREGKRVLQFSPFSFDASVWETVMALGNGATLVLTQQEALASGPALLRLLQEQRVTTVTLPPSLLTVLTPEALPELETVIAAGERCANEIVQAWAPGRNFFNAYGPTETTVCASMHRCDPAANWPFGGPPIGKALANFQLYVADENLQTQPIGVPGELLVGGPSLAQGYLNRPELTAERFISEARCEFGEFGRIRSENAVLYRTGDLVRWLADGNLEFIGRIDDQVKVRGFRIELGEIESVMREHEAVRDAVVAARDNTLIGYYIATDAAADRVERNAAVRAHLRRRLPEYMVPSALVTMDAFPLTPAGKIDRKSLPAADQARRDASAEYVAPRNEIEAKLAEMAAQLLKVERVGMEDNFFELGGHSLLATQLISRIRDDLKVETPLKALFEHPTVGGLAVVVDEAVKKQAAEQAKVTDALAMVKGMSPEQVKALLAAKRAAQGHSASPEQGGKGAGA
jgi:amino acid adenylation domain-containing protein